MASISLVAAARPNFMKVAPLLRALESLKIPSTLIHTGQHYDEQMSGGFFRQLGIRSPEFNLAVGSGSQIFQVAEVMRRLEDVFLAELPKMVVVVGDVNSTLAATLAAVKLDIPVAHVEAGLRSFDRSMPEEVNRMLVDAVSRWLFVSEPSGLHNLKREGKCDDEVFYVGNIMIDTLFASISKIREMRIHERYGVEPRRFALLTLHRPSNVDCEERLRGILRAVGRLSKRMPVLFPIHPRTSARIREFGLESDAECCGYTRLEPVGYHESIGLMDTARMVLTDSGGMQEESTALRIPCITIRDSTERPVTITEGSNRLVGWQADEIQDAINVVLGGPELIGRLPKLWDGNAALRIAKILSSKLALDEGCLSE